VRLIREHPTSNIQHPTSNIERRTSKDNFRQKRLVAVFLQMADWRFIFPNSSGSFTEPCAG